jgi:hypothetical protein
METIYFSETSVDFQRTTRRYVPEVSTFHSHRCENLKSYLVDSYNDRAYINLENLFSINKSLLFWVTFWVAWATLPIYVS